MNHQELETEMLKAARTLTQQIDRYRAEGENYAVAKHDYSVALSKKLLTLRDEGQSVSLAESLAKGDERVAEYREQKDVAYARWRAAGAHIGVLQSQVDICRTLFAWERQERFENPIPGGE